MSDDKIESTAGVETEPRIKAADDHAPTSAEGRDEAPEAVLLRAPSAWASAKGDLAGVPWKFRAASVAQKWPNEEHDPGFAISEAEYDAAIEHVVGITLGCTSARTTRP